MMTVQAAGPVPRRRRDPRAGQAMVEFALVIPLMLALIFTTMSLAFLLFQSAAVSNGAQQGARAATLQKPLVDTVTNCEPPLGGAGPIEKVVRNAAIGLPVGTSTMCASSTTQMRQRSTPANGATIVVDATPSLAAPTSIAVTITYVAKPLWPFLPAGLTLRSTSRLDLK